MKAHMKLRETHKFDLYSLTMRVEASQHGKCDCYVEIAFKVDIVGLRKDVDELKSIALLMLVSTVEIPDAPSVDVQSSFEVPCTITTRDVSMEEVQSKSKVETDDKELGVHEVVEYEDMEYLKGTIVQSVVEVSVRDTLIMGCSRIKDVDDVSTDVS